MEPSFEAEPVGQTRRLRGPLLSSGSTGVRDSARPDVGCLQPLLALLNVEFDFLALGEGPVTGHLDRRVVNENVHAVGLEMKP